MKHKIRSRRISINLSQEEFEVAHRHYWNSPTGGTAATYFRKLVLGEIFHPLAPPKPQEAQIPNDTFSNTGEVKSGPSTLLHFLAYVVAAQYIELDTDPEKRKLINDNLETYEQLVEELWGYKYDVDANQRSPLPRTYT